MTTDEVYELATRIHLKGNASLQAALQELDPAEADFLGITAAQQREQLLQRAIQEAAADCGLLPWTYMLTLVEGSGVDVQHLREQGDREEAEALGLDKLI
ncbi:hypothetical protein KVG96_14710 [Pseudomonas sp. COR58]|uniref:Uncharacterized protein n=1 Tax=Pseudomonas ekonensis TaxID=2842353 RepID=A0ABS6PFF5_9PSED|nr:DUF6388 family protein [Pseudomonas ekonensis]MBV4459207.1 hypothetical protein [Pseudomonas ekonensis]